jgi:hypothetical protein
MTIETDEGDFPELADGISWRRWCERNRTPAENAAEIRRILLAAPSEHQEALRVTPDGEDLRFWIHKCLLVGVRC